MRGSVSNVSGWGGNWRAGRPELGVLFVDMDAFFASVEQMDRPELRGRPIAVTPTSEPDEGGESHCVARGGGRGGRGGRGGGRPVVSGCCIACSYEARALGVKTGCRVGDAMAISPEVVIVCARPDRYVQVHHQILKAIETVVPVTEVESVDECWARLMRNERDVSIARQLAERIKAAVASQVGPITCSIGIAPNRFVAKVASGMNKPDGLTVIRRSQLPGPLLGLGLCDLPGINKGINRRLRAAGIHTVEQLYQRSQEDLRRAWGSVLGVYWWHWLRGEVLPSPRTHRRTVGHQHVLAPKYRDRDQAKGVAVRLLSKAAQRMRALGYVATRLTLWVQPMGAKAWSDWIPMQPTADTIELHNALAAMWHDVPAGRILQLGVRLEGLERADTQLLLFDHEQKRSALMEAVDAINRRCGVDAVYLGVMHHQRKTAPRRIPFGKPPDLNLPDVSRG